MARLSRQVAPLVWKELRQMRRSRAALLSSTLLPVLMLVVMPLGQLAALRSAGPGAATGPAASPVNDAVLGRFQRPEDMFVYLLLPLFVALTGVVVPAVATAYAVVAERERHSLDLLMALPVSVTDVLVAKVLSVLASALLVVLPLFVVDAVVFVAQGVLTPLDVALLALVLLGALCCSIGVTFIITIIARDYRTANNLSGLQVGPVIVLTPLLLFALPPRLGLVALAAALALAGAIALVVARRWITFERYLA
jgi:ABC-type transport system involved in multi-copper enzyme maturation permease subunit